MIDNIKYEEIKCLPRFLQETFNYIHDELAKEIINIISQNEAPLSGHITSYIITYIPKD